MFRRWLSTFWKNNKEKIMQIAKIFGIIVGIGFSAGIVLSSLGLEERDETNTVSQIYSPEKTVISGVNISEEEYEKENNLAQTFVDYCNEQKLEEAYSLLTVECKEKLYPTVQDFKEKYYDIIFQEDRIFSLQSWINKGNYNTYKISYTGDFMATGDYDGTKKFEDYITVVTDEDGNKKVNVNSYIKTEEINKQTQSKNLEVEALYCDIYMNYVIYKIRIKNITDKDILLDSLENYDNIKLVGTNEATYRLDKSNLRLNDLIVKANGQKEISLKFFKVYGSEVTGKSIKFTNVITNYIDYIDEREKYENFDSITISI